jgi:GGDEF domain-containing protein
MRKDAVLRITVSIEIGVIMPSDKGLDDLLGCADKALYSVEAKGRNRVDLS